VKRERGVELVSAAVYLFAASFSEQIADLVGAVRAYSVYGAFGMLLGWIGYRLAPRPLAERLAVPAVLLPLGLVLGFLPGTEIEQHFSAAGMGVVGIIAGLVLGENYGSSDRDVAPEPEE
jgi:hypothetical protein